MQWLPPSHHQLLPPANRGDHASYPILLWFLPWPRPGWLYCYRLLVPPTQFMCCILNAAPPQPGSQRATLFGDSVFTKQTK